MSSGAAPPKRIAVAGGGISGLATAYQLACDGVDCTLFEASERLGGIVETVRKDGFVIECGPDSWVTEKPWARELAVELGLEDQIIGSNDQWRRTYVQQGGEASCSAGPHPRRHAHDGPGQVGPAAGIAAVQLAGPACLSAGAKTRRRAQGICPGS